MQALDGLFGFQDGEAGRLQGLFHRDGRLAGLEELDDLLDDVALLVHLDRIHGRVAAGVLELADGLVDHLLDADLGPPGAAQAELGSRAYKICLAFSAYGLDVRGWEMPALFLAYGMAAIFLCAPVLLFGLPSSLLIAALLLGIWAVSLAPAAGADTAGLRRKQQAQEKARVLAGELVSAVLDIQLRQLAENGLIERPIYKDIAAMKGNIGHLMQRDMEAVRAIGGRRIAAPPAGVAKQTALDLLAAARRYRDLLDLGRRMEVTPQLELWGSSKFFSRLGELAFVAVESGRAEACLLPEQGQGKPTP